MYVECERLGNSATLEYLVETEDGLGRIDVATWNHETFLGIEIERDNRRIAADIKKSLAVQADALLIVVPNRQIQRLVTKRIERIAPQSDMEIFVGCLPEAIARLRHFFPPK